MLRTFAITTALLLAAAGARAQDRPSFRVTRAAQPPKLDGILDDEAWQPIAPMALGEWLSYNPNRGDKMSPDFRTEVRIAYDDRNLYFAFHCIDSEPDRIRTTVARRDSAFNDDWIAISLDSAANGQTAYHLFVNPSGSLMDAVNTSSSGEQFDADLVWYGVGRKTADGYIIEMQVPLQTIRFSAGDNVPMGILFFRKISRLGISYSWPPMPPGQWVFENHARLVFDSLKQPRLVEALPSLTYGVSQQRDTVARWNPLDGRADVGMSGKFGITSNITLDGTVNPDFSQVESDAFQAEVNQRFPIFFSEKRPFFMEGKGLFNVAGTGAGNLLTAVHTRKIVNPLWGSKVTGTAGKTTFGVLNALDERPEDLGNRGEAIAGRDKYFTIGRATYALRKADYIGAIFTDTEHAGRYNRAAGADLSLKPTPSQQVTAMVLTTQTGLESLDTTSGNAYQATYGYETRRINSFSIAEHYDRGFQMDTAFYNRTGMTSAFTYNEVSFYPKGGGDFWIQRVHPYFLVRRGYDEVQRGHESSVQFGLKMNFTRQAFFEIGRASGYTAWQGQRYDDGRDLNVYGFAQILRWLNVGAGWGQGASIYYDEVNPFQGRSHGGFASITLQPNQHFNTELNLNFDRFDRASNGERIYSVNIINSKTTYQFDKHFLVRLLEQYDSTSHRLLTDLLASYEFLPGTVFHAGYGSLYEKNAVRNTGGLVNDGLGDQYVLVNRGLFFKASYLHRF